MMKATKMNILRRIPARRTVLIPLLGLVAVGLVAGCSGDEPTAAPAAPTATPSPTVATEPAAAMEPAPAATAVPEPTAPAPQVAAPQPTAVPEPTATAAPAPTATTPPTAAPEPAATAAPTAAPEPAATATPEPQPTVAPEQEAGEVPLERYGPLCTYLDATQARDFGSYGEFSAHLDEVLAEAGAFPPPPEVLDWHEAVLAFLESMKELVVGQPADAPIDPFVLAPVLPSVANLQQAELLLEPEARERLAEIGCVAPQAGPAATRGG